MKETGGNLQYVGFSQVACELRFVIFESYFYILVVWLTLQHFIQGYCSYPKGSSFRLKITAVILSEIVVDVT